MKTIFLSDFSALKVLFVLYYKDIIKKGKIPHLRINDMSSLSSRFKGVTYAGLVYGAIAGLIATWSISTAIAIAEVIIGWQ
ncbi:MAG TPA: hypothetical protein VHG34_00955, partial [Nitrososphaeraceae archaeon]|nr:hypothetical protein [Nitrososphaeraceae archaeon]